MGELRTTSPDALIIGCGYLGSVLARRLIGHGVTVFGTTRDAQRARALAGMGVRALMVDVHQPVTFAALRPALERELLDVYCLLPPGRLPAGVEPSADPALRGLANVIEALEGAWIHRAVMTSSTAVYGQSGDERVDADTPPAPGSDRARRLLHLEKLWLEGGMAYRVLRLAGLYGPGRIVGLEAVRQGHPLVGNGRAMLNLIHVEDAAELLIAHAGADDAHAVELGSDGSPAARIDYYGYLAEKMGVAAPSVVDDETAVLEMGLNLDRLRRVSSKRCDPTVTGERCGWRPRYGDFRQGLDELVPQAV